MIYVFDHLTDTEVLCKSYAHFLASYLHVYRRLLSSNALYKPVERADPKTLNDYID